MDKAPSTDNNALMVRAELCFALQRNIQMEYKGEEDGAGKDEESKHKDVECTENRRRLAFAKSHSFIITPPLLYNGKEHRYSTLRVE